MEPRRPSRVIDPKVRKVGFFTPGPPPDRTRSGPAATTPTRNQSPVSNSLSPVMIPPARHASDNLSRAVGMPVPVASQLHAHPPADSLQVGSYTPSDSVISASPTRSPSSRIGLDGEFSEDSINWMKRSNSGRISAARPTGGPDLKQSVEALINESGGDLVLKEPLQKNSKPLKAKTTKAEMRALQETQRAAKATAKGNKPGTTSGMSAPAQTSKPVNKPNQKKDGPPMVSSTIVPERKGGDKPPEKDRKKDMPPPRMQFDDKSRVEKAKKRSVTKQTEARNRVELFRHLPQYERGNQLSDLESKFFQLDHVHPAVYKVGLQFLAGDIMWSNTRCIAMLQAFQKVIEDYSTPSEKTLARDLTSKINSSVSFLIECRPLSISMGNAIRFLKSRIAKITLAQTESEAKTFLCSDIDRYINEKIVLADKVIVRHAVTKIRDGDVLLTYGSSSLVEMILLHAHELRRQFRVVVVDSRPNLEGQQLLRRLVEKGFSCTYTHINAVSYIMHEVTRIFLGAASVLSNGTVYSTVGTACIAMVAHAHHVPVLICCESYKFHERVQLDSICSNELGNPDAIAKVPGRTNNCLDDWAGKENLQLLNLAYDVTPSDYVSMIVTEHGMIPPTSVPVIVREYGREHLLI
ncbi:probable translation initiation factor eIF-2B subunit delta isoform X2 [Cynara cardunculus var. scolymus]|uniref:probable translation initiation factor eIF-2B subunit delta isoform X2 n=1 Tax=Cynara cardunculus var. scolymus TaxID=59895 RepID=UPI000D62A284|nr:probable translation initiation factor eIF-2B subunit delta isoform X2 [Cynara cardunculus var. scolymus]